MDKLYKKYMYTYEFTFIPFGQNNHAFIHPTICYSSTREYNNGDYEINNKYKKQVQQKIIKNKMFKSEVKQSKNMHIHTYVFCGKYKK